MKSSIKLGNKIIRVALFSSFMVLGFASIAIGDSLNLKLRLYDSLITYHPKKAGEVLAQLNLFLKNNKEKEFVAVQIANSKWFIELGFCDSAMFFAQNARKRSKSLNTQSASDLAVAAAYRCKALPDSALVYYFMAEKKAQACNDSSALMSCYFRMGHVYSETGKFEKAAIYYEISSKIAVTLKNKEYIARTSLAIASNLADRGMLIKAQPLLKLSRIQCKNAGLIRQQAIACNNLGTLYKQLNQFKEALKYFQESIELQTSLNNFYEIATEYNNIATIHIIEKRFDFAISILLKAELLALNLNQSALLPEIYHNLSICYEQTGDYRAAFEYKNTEKQLTDSLRSLEMLKNTERLQEEFEAEKRTLEINNLKQENEVKELRSMAHLKQRNWFMALAAGLFIMALLVFFFFRQRVLNARRLNQKNTLIHQQQMQEVIRKSELQSMHTMLETQETERKRIAQDLHDRLGSMLSTVKLQFGHFSPKANEDKERYSKVSHLLDDAVEEIRQVSHNLVSGVLSTFGLVPALKDLIQALKESSALAIELQVHGMNERMDSELEINLYRILQELFNNTIRHAKAGRVDIELSRHPNELTLIYSDNGTGFDTQNLKQSGMGLKNMYSRVDKLGGSLHIDSGKGNGSTFVFNFPLL